MMMRETGTRSTIRQSKPNAAQPATHSTRGREIGSLIGGVFGMVFVAVNSGGIAPAARGALVAAAGAALVGVLVLGVRSYRHSRSGTIRSPRNSGPPFGRSYWVIVAVEALALFGGTRLITAVLDRPELGVAWVSVVVGTHFFALGRIFGLVRFHVLAALIALCGAVGFGLAWTGSGNAVALVSGVLPGFVLLGFAVGALAQDRT